MPTDSNSATSTAPSLARGAISGLLAGAVALATGELIAGLLAPTPSLITGVANRVIEESPAWLTDFGKRTFGTNQKTALVVGTLVLAAVFAAALGIASRRRPSIGAAGITAFGFLGMISIGADPQGSLPAGGIIAGGAVLTGIVALAFLLASHPDAVMLAPSATVAASSAPTRRRRSFLQLTGGAGVLAVVATVAGRGLRNRSSTEEARAALDVTSTADSSVAADVASVASGEVASTPGITPIVIPNKDFYRIDTAIVVPQVNPANWELTIDGMVDRPTTFTFEDLVERASLVEPVTLSCVSNDVGGGLVGNAIWRGVPLTDLLDEAGVQSGATQIASRSVDGWTCGFPTDLAYDGRTAMVAIAMNDEALPLEHGFPARLVVSGLYGYVSATKWLERITLTTLEDFDGYWISRGWDKDGPVKTQSRIDTPRRGEQVVRDVERAIAGVTWAPNIGIRRVEVQVDDGPWAEAELGESLGINAWRQWRLRWTPTNENHRIRVRATDETGETQTEVRSGGYSGPNGATGWHTIEVKT